MRTAWKKIRYRLEWLALKSATKFLSLLSRKAYYRLALLLGSLGAMLDRRGRRVALSNLRVAFGDEISSERRAQIVRESYQHFARTMLDLVRTGFFKANETILFLHTGGQPALFAEQYADEFKMKAAFGAGEKVEQIS